MTDDKKTGKARTQPETRDEQWSDERLAAFLAIQPPASLPADYNILLKAYRGMTAELFARFVPIFVAAGHDINVALDDGSTFLDHVLQHRKATDYVNALKAAGATSRSTN